MGRRQTACRVVPLLALSLALFAGPAMAGELRGRIVDPSGEPVRGAVVSIPELALVAVTDTEGAFLFQEVPDGDYVLQAEGAGTVPTRLPVTVPSTEPVTVTALYINAIKEGKRELERQADQEEGLGRGGGALSATDAGAVKVQLLCTNCNAAAVSMLGLSEDHLRLGYDRVEIFEGIQAIWAMSMVPPETIEKTEILPGPYSVFSGSEGLAGRMRLLSHDPFESMGVHTKVLRGSNDLWGAEVAARGKLGENSAGDVVATYSESDPINPNRDARNEQGQIDRVTFQGRYYHRFNERDRLRVGFQYYEENQYDGPGTALWTGYPDDEVKWFGQNIPIIRREFNAAWEHEFESGAFLEASAMKSDRVQLLEEESFGDPDVFFPVFDIQADYRWAEMRSGGFLGNRVMLEGGVTYAKEVLDVHDHSKAFTCPEDEFITDIIENYAGFAEATISLPGRVDLIAGLRYDDFRQFGDAWLPRLGVRWKPLQDLYVTFGAGKEYRPPRPIFEEVCCGNTYQTNEEVLPEEGWGVHTSLAWYPTQKVKLTFAAQHSEFDDMILHLVTNQRPIATYNGNYRNENQPNATITGAEIGINVRLDRGVTLGGSFGKVWTGSEGDVWSRPRICGTDDYTEILVLPDGTDKLPYINEEVGTVFVTWTGRLWDAALNSNYFGPQWIQKLKDETTPGFPDRLGGEVLPVLFPTPSYWNINVQAGRKVGNFRVFAGIDNVLDEYQDDFADPTTSAKWGLQRGIFYYAGFSFDLNKPIH